MAEHPLPLLRRTSCATPVRVECHSFVCQECSAGEREEEEEEEEEEGMKEQIQCQFGGHFNNKPSLTGHPASTPSMHRFFYYYYCPPLSVTCPTTPTDNHQTTTTTTAHPTAPSPPPPPPPSAPDFLFFPLAHWVIGRSVGGGGGVVFSTRCDSFFLWSLPHPHNFL